MNDAEYWRNLYEYRTALEKQDYLLSKEWYKQICITECKIYLEALKEQAKQYGF